MFQPALSLSPVRRSRRTSIGQGNLLALLLVWSLSAPLMVASAQPPDAVLDAPPPPPLPVPPPVTPPLTLPTDEADAAGGVQQVVIPLSDEVRRRIEAALRRPASDDQGRPLPPATTGDPILDDVLEVIRRRGSLLDGSALDPQEELAADDLSRPPALLPPIGRRQGSAGESLSDLLGREVAGDGLDGAVNRDAGFEAAEALLRAARKLSALSGDDEGAQRLIAAMRERATMLLLDEFSPSAAQLE